LIINYKSRETVNYFAHESYGSGLREYPELNAVGRELIEEVAEEMHRADPLKMRDDDLFDTFSNWLVAVKKYKFRHTRYWKVAPGRDAWQWDEWRREGFTAIGWNEVGDMSALSRAEFDARRDELVAEHEDWGESGVKQVWTFAHHIKEGDRVVANRGTSEVLGIGTVVGPYEFVPEARHSHQMLVEWDDCAPRRVNEGGWRKTLIELDREKFEVLSKAPSAVGAHHNVLSWIQNLRTQASFDGRFHYKPLLLLAVLDTLDADPQHPNSFRYQELLTTFERLAAERGSTVVEDQFSPPRLLER
jgi:hypothetical protein